MLKSNSGSSQRPQRRKGLNALDEVKGVHTTETRHSHQAQPYAESSQQPPIPNTKSMVLASQEINSHIALCMRIKSSIRKLKDALGRRWEKLRQSEVWTSRTPAWHKKHVDRLISLQRYVEDEPLLFTFLCLARWGGEGVCINLGKGRNPS